MVTLFHLYSGYHYIFNNLEVIISNKKSSSFYYFNISAINISNSIFVLRARPLFWNIHIHTKPIPSNDKTTTDIKGSSSNKGNQMHISTNLLSYDTK